MKERWSSVRTIFAARKLVAVPCFHPVTRQQKNRNLIIPETFATVALVKDVKGILQSHLVVSTCMYSVTFGVLSPGLQCQQLGKFGDHSMAAGVGATLVRIRTTILELKPDTNDVKKYEKV